MWQWRQAKSLMKIWYLRCVSRCFKSVSRCFTSVSWVLNDVLRVFHDVLSVSRCFNSVSRCFNSVLRCFKCFTMFYECFTMFYILGVTFDFRSCINNHREQSQPSKRTSVNVVVYRGEFLKFNGMQPNFQEWRCLPHYYLFFLMSVKFLPYDFPQWTLYTICSMGTPRVPSRSDARNIKLVPLLSTNILPMNMHCRLYQKPTLKFYSNFIPWVATKAVRWPGVPKVARLYLSQCSKSRDLQPALNCTIRAQGVLPCVGWGCDQSKLDLPSLTPLYVASCGRLATRGSPLGYFGQLLQVVENWTHILW